MIDRPSISGNYEDTDGPNLRRFWGWAALLLALGGCGDHRPARVPVSGVVLIDGQPLAHGFIRFVPSGARVSQSALDSNGRFQLGCFEAGDGAVPGTHRVEVNGLERINDWTARWHAPKKYADYQTSGITKEVTGPTDSMQIELSWDGAKPFTEIDESARPSAVDRRPGRNNK